jgi:hypothetical protein
MNPEQFNRLEKKLDDHIKRHDEDYRKLLLWIVSTVIGLVIGAVSIFVTYGQTIEKVSKLEEENSQKVNRTELQASIDLINEKFNNINEKLDDIKDGLNIK